ncbi:hypothetical protein JW859_02760 [bacterium]|nr:hypothetical protein [bacterium]
MLHLHRLVAAVICIGLLSSGCNAKSQVVSLPDGPSAPVEPVTLWNALPAPSQLKLASELPGQPIQDAANFIEPHHGVSADGAGGLFAAGTGEPGLAAWSWATYGFQFDDFQQPFTVYLGWDTPPLGEDLFIGVANWELDCWEWLEATEPIVYALPADQTDAINADGQLLVVTCFHLGVDRTLAYVEIGAQPWETHAHTWGGFDNEFINDMALDDEGNLYLVGETWTFSAGHNDLLLVKCSPDGELVWARTYGSAGRETGAGLCCDGSSVFVCGSVRDVGDDYFNGLVQKWTSAGDLQASKRWQGDNEDRLEAIHSDGNGLHLGGLTYSLGELRFDCDPLLLNADFDLDGLLSAYTFGTEENNEGINYIAATKEQLDELEFTCGGGASVVPAPVYLGGAAVCAWAQTPTLAATTIIFRAPILMETSMYRATSIGPKRILAFGGFDASADCESVAAVMFSLDRLGDPLIMHEFSIVISASDLNLECSAVASTADRIFLGANVGISNWPDVEWYPAVLELNAEFKASFGSAWGDGNPGNALEAMAIGPDGRLYFGGIGAGASGYFHTFEVSSTEVESTWTIETTTVVNATGQWLADSGAVADRTADFLASEDSSPGQADLFLGTVQQ